jgi:hypothetical protein
LDRPRLDKVDAAAEQRLKRLFKAEKGLERHGPRRGAVELNEKIKIAARQIEIVARRRAEQVEAAHMEPAAQFSKFLSTQ